MKTVEDSKVLELMQTNCKMSESVYGGAVARCGVLFGRLEDAGDGAFYQGR
ncbi:MAG: hypothetical protein HLUCCA11_06520 [Phormidesmis priestleyi Ana]|uniref:Uncharacterized protein n=1 Tax=Phormidesmis priestleyi Ana TaxID=1666911 RepID=A0A0N8KNH0_9CYAN|nr:MAG: hypothetical protein HLUCCA11_06520 [Phormidesmis priestleyi Ana]